MSRISNTRRSLMFCAATAAIGTILSTSPACAQSVPDQADGTQLVTDHQRADHSRRLADTSGFRIVVEPLFADGSDLTLRDNAVSALARANRSDSALRREPIGRADHAPRTDLTSGNGGVNASGDTLLVTTQRGLSSISIATSSDGVLGAGTDTLDAHGSRILVADNLLDTQALGNDATAALSLTGTGEAAAAAGILGFQSNDNRSAVLSTNLARLRAGVGAISGSDMAITGTLVRARGSGNSFSSSLGATGTSAVTANLEAPASRVPGTATGDPMVSATFATLSHQEQSGSISALVGAYRVPDPFRIAAFGQVSDSSLRQDGNALVAASYGNQSENAMQLRLNAIAGSGAVATVTGVQRAADANVEADTLGGIRTNLLRSAERSRLSLSDNSAQAVANANFAKNNQLRVEAGTIDTFGPVAGPAASTGNDGSITATGAFSVQNIQDFGNARVGAVTTTALLLGVLGPVDGSSLFAGGNNVSAAGTGNGATNSLSVSATAARTSASLNNVQTGDGEIRVQAGESVAPLGVVLDLPGTVRNSDLAVRGNMVTGSAIGNSASSTMTIVGTSVTGGTGHGDAAAGPLADSYGAAADFALASSQKLGLSGSAEDAVGISSSVSSRFGILAGSRAYGSDYAVDGNGARATVIGNTVANRLSLTGVTLGGTEASAPGTALSSAQYGQVDGRASSVQTLAVPGSLSGSGVAVKGNTNQAYAGINEADNKLSVDSVDPGTRTGRGALAVIGEGPAISGDDVLGSVQFAGGSIAADAVTRVANGDSRYGLAASRFAIEDNHTAAEASANRAVNTVELAPGGGAGTGLANMQMNTASVAARVGIDAAYPPSGSSPMPVVDAASLTIADNAASAVARGNAAENVMAIPGAAQFDAGATSQSGRYHVQAYAGAPLLNAQSNYGSIAASVSGSLVGASLNAPLAGMTDASVEIRGNVMSAAAYGNTAVNTINGSPTGNMPGAAIVSTQVNYGPVMAVAAGNQLTLPLGTMTNSSAALIGNQISAVAVGNQSMSTISGQR